MSEAIIYIFDPICGWCYGALPRLEQLAEQQNLTLLPSGLFSEAGSSELTPLMAEKFWSYDREIARQSGQIFSELYYNNVLKGPDQFIDSTWANLALSAIALIHPDRSLEALSLIQEARWQHGKDIISAGALIELLKKNGFEEASALLEKRNSELLKFNDEQIAKGRRLLQMSPARGVPQLLRLTEGQLPQPYPWELFSNR